MADQDKRDNRQARALPVLMLTCTQCNAVGAPHYTWTNKKGEVKPLKKCTQCHNAGKYQKKGAAYTHIPDDVKAKVKAMIAGRSKFREIANETKLPYGSLIRWIRRGVFQ